jgi:hypothetical protein
VIRLRWLLGCAVLTGLACRDVDPALEMTADGVPIIPYQSVAAAVQDYTSSCGAYRFHLQAWTNRMPTVPPGRGTDAGFPLYVALQVQPTAPAGGTDSLRITALTLWAPDGDLLWSAMALVTPDGREPWVHSGRALPTELTNDRKRPRRSAAPPNARVSPHLLIVDRGRQTVLRLPDIQITAAY